MTTLRQMSQTASGGAPVTLCPHVAGDLRRLTVLSADLDLVLSGWCGRCRFERGEAGELAAVLAVWPMLNGQAPPLMGQRYERQADGAWLLEEDLG